MAYKKDKTWNFFQKEFFDKIFKKLALQTKVFEKCSKKNGNSSEMLKKGFLKSAGVRLFFFKNFLVSDLFSTPLDLRTILNCESFFIPNPNFFEVKKFYWLCDWTKRM